MALRRSKADTAIEKRIEKLYQKRCDRVEIPMMKIPTIYQKARDAIKENPEISDEDLGDKIVEYVATIRTN